MTMFLGDREMDGQIQRTLAAAYSGSCDLGEALATAARITPGDYDGWHREWATTAGRCDALGDECLRAGHRVTAAKAFLRAVEYYRQAIFFIRHDLDDPRLLAGWRAHRAAFRKALPLLPLDAEIAGIPFGGAEMTAYLLRPAGGRIPRPTVLAPCGFDSTAEAGYASTAHMALARGYNVLLWEGPGQGGMLYQHRVPMRPNFEHVLAPVIDWASAQDGVDPGRLALIGRSFAGYLAPRAAAFEPRIAALVCDPGQVEFVSRFVPGMVPENDWNRILASDPAADAALEGLLADPRGREYYGARMATFGAATLGDFLRMQPAYTVEPFASRISCPTLVTEGEGDFASQSRWLFDLLTCAKELRTFPAAEGAGGHCCGLGATIWEGAVFDWLDNVLALQQPDRC